MDPYPDPFSECDLNFQANLPDDCLLNIFQKLSNTPDRNAFGLTCCRWLHIQNLARRSLVFQFSYNPRLYQIYTTFLPRLLARFPHLSSISLAGPELSDSALTQLRNSGSSLRTLSLYCCFGLTDDGLASVCARCPQLVSLTLYRCNVSDIGLESVAGSCLALETVSLSYCTLVSDPGIAALATRCLKIRALMISYCKGITGTGFRGCSSSLAYLEADSCVLTREGVSEAVSGGGLEYLNLSSTGLWVDEDGFKGIGGGSAARLKFLNLRLCRFVGDESVVAIAKGCPLLEEWNLAVCHEVRLGGWRTIGSCCRNLKVLHVNRCRNLCDGGLEALRGCGRLRVLHMNGCRRVTFMAVESLKIWRPDVELRGVECVSIGPSIDDLFA